MYSLSGIVKNDMNYYMNTFNTISSYISDNIHSTNNYFYNSIYTISCTLYFNYINRDTLTNRLQPYTLYTDTITQQNNLFSYMHSLSGIVNNDMNYCMNTFNTISSYISDNIHNTNIFFYNSIYTIRSTLYFNYINRDSLTNILNDYVTTTSLTSKLIYYLSNIA